MVRVVQVSYTVCEIWICSHRSSIVVADDQCSGGMEKVILVDMSVTVGDIPNNATAGVAMFWALLQLAVARGSMQPP